MRKWPNSKIYEFVRLYKVQGSPFGDAKHWLVGLHGFAITKGLVGCSLRSMEGCEIVAVAEVVDVRFLHDDEILLTVLVIVNNVVWKASF